MTTGSDDTFFGSGSLAQLTDFAHFDNNATGFDIVHATSENGGTDTMDVDAVTYDLRDYGPWIWP